MHVFFCVSKNVSVSCAYTQGKREQFSGFNRTLDAINNVFRTFSAFHDETGRLNVDGMNIISNDGSNKLNRSRKARVSYKVQRTINASLNAATSTRAVSSNQNFVTRIRVRNIRALNGRFNTSITHAYSIVIGSKHITLNATGGGFLTASKQFRHGATSKSRSNTASNSTKHKSPHLSGWRQIISLIT